MSKRSFEERRDELFQLSDRLFGSAEELSLAEAEVLLRTTGIEPDEVVRTVQERMAAKAKAYELAKRPVPVLLHRALEELATSGDLRGGEAGLFGKACAAVSRLLEQVKRLPATLAAGATPTFAAAYRKKKKLSDRDMRLLDGVANDLRKRAEGDAKRS